MFRKILLAMVVGTGLSGGANLARAGDKNQDVQKLFDEEGKLRDAKKYEEAIAVLDKLLLLDPKNSYAWSEGAYIFNEMEKYDAAVQAGEKALELNVDNSDAWRELGYALMKLKRHADANKALTSAIEKNPRNWFAYTYLAENYEKQGKFTAATDTRDRMAKEKKRAEMEAAKKNAEKDDSQK